MTKNDLIDTGRAVLNEIRLPGNNKHQIFLKREDLIHPEISGNKWRKLKYNLKFAIENNYTSVLTFGGAYSNHIYAAAAAAKMFGLKSIGIIRGELPVPLNETLKFAGDCGMELYFLNRTDYRKRNEVSFQQEIAKKHGNPYVIPEGGTNRLALLGVAELLDEINTDYDYLSTPVGSGGTIAGLIEGLKGNKIILGFPALKNGGYLVKDINNLLNRLYDNWLLIPNYHFGGFAKIKPGLVEFIKSFEDLNGIKIEPIYTGKMLYGINDMIKKGYFSEPKRIIALHTGGLQGLAGMEPKMNKLTEPLPFK